MDDTDDASELPFQNENSTEVSRSRPRTREPVSTVAVTTTTTSSTSTRIPYFYIPRRPKVVKMRDLSEATKARIAKEYFDAYDPWTGVRIAATLGILISLFTLFLIYKSKYNKTRNSVIASKKTSLYLYEEDLECDLEHIGASDDTGSFAYSYRYADKLPRDFHFGLGNHEYPLEEVFVKSSMAECVALTVHKNNKNSKGPKYGTLRITKEPSHSLPCSPYKPKNKDVPCHEEEETGYTAVKYPFSPTPPECTSSLSGSITSFGSSEYNDKIIKANVCPRSREENIKFSNKFDAIQVEKDVEEQGPGLFRKPQDYRSRSTVVSIGRRKRKT